MPKTEELNGMGYPNFRTGRKSFATIEDAMAVIRLTRDQQAIFVATAPEVFAPDSSGWGRLGNTVIRLEAADEATVQVAVATAWSNVAEVVNASEAVDVAAVEIATELVNAAEVVEASDEAEVANVVIVDAADVDAPDVKVLNVGEVTAEVGAAEVPNGAEVVEASDAAEVADEVSAAEVVNRAEVVEDGDASDVVNTTVVVNAAEAAGEVSTAEVPNVEVVETESVAVSVEPHDHLLSVIDQLQVSWGR